MKTKIPFVDLHAQYLGIKQDIDNAIADTIANSAYIGGEAIRKFEHAFAKFAGLEHVIACGNGTDSLEILLKAAGIKKGDEVIVPSTSWISTSEAVGNVGATPVFADIDPVYYTIDVDAAEKVITGKTKAIIPVHLYGHPADMPKIMRLADRYNLFVIEDCAQSHGAIIDGKKAGTFGNAASYSFYPGKNLGAYGDAGCMATNNEELAVKVRMIANHGQQGKHNHLIEGRNSRMDGLQAAILNAKLPHLQKWIDARIRVAGYYDDHLFDSHISIPKVRENCIHAYHLYVIRTERREDLRKLLADEGIETAIHYPTPLPFLPCYRDRNFSAKDFPVAAAYQQTILSLPIYPELTSTQQDSIIKIIKDAAAG